MGLSLRMVPARLGSAQQNRTVCTATSNSHHSTIACSLTYSHNVVHSRSVTHALMWNHVTVTQCAKESHTSTCSKPHQKGTVRKERALCGVLSVGQSQVWCHLHAMSSSESIQA